MRFTFLSFFAALLYCTPLLAQTPPESENVADQWTRAFEAVVDELVQSDRVLVAAGNEASQVAASSLINVMRQRELALVMDDEALGPLKGVSDEEIREKAKPLPVEGVVIVRVFPSASSEVAVVVESRGSTLRTASVTRGKTQAPEVVQSTQVGPIDPEAARQAEQRAAQDDAQERGEKRAQPLAPTARSLIDELESLNRGRFERQKLLYSQNPYEFFKGVDRTPVGPGEFYQTIGDEELLDAFQTDSGLKTGILVTSGGLSALAFGLSFVGIVPAFDGGDVNWTLTGIGIGTGVVAVSGLIWGALIDPHPITPDEARSKADSYNDRLQQDLGIAP